MISSRLNAARRQYEADGETANEIEKGFYISG
jgi:hypothetical protein